MLKKFVINSLFKFGNDISKIKKNEYIVKYNFWNNIDISFEWGILKI